MSLADRKLHVKKPRLRQRSEGEVPVPAYEALQKNGPSAQRLLATLLRGVSTRSYQGVIPEMAAIVGVKKSSIGRKVNEASAEQMRQLRERRWDKVDIQIIYIDGQRFGDHIISAVGVDLEGRKHVLGIEPGATENSAAVKRLLTHLRDHGLATERQYLFVIDGTKAHRAAIDEVFGTEHPVQRCRNHKLRNMIDELPKDQHAQAMNLMRAAWKLRPAEAGEQRLEHLARFLEARYESAARSLRAGLAEMFTLQRLMIPPSLHKCLATTNLIEGPQGGVQKRTANVTRRRDQDMAERWVASAWLETEKKSRRISGHQDL